jgi:hypothetical protein
MITEAALAVWIQAHAQTVAADYERDRLSIECAHHAGSQACTAIVDPARLARPSTAWIAEVAHEIVTAPLLPDPKIEAVHMLIYAWGESLYRDDANVPGDGACSMGVIARFHHVTPAELVASPALCVRLARASMRWSFAANPNVPMAQYCGGATRKGAIWIADHRAALVKLIAAKLPEVTE